MKLNKSNVCVLIESEAQLQQAREMLERYGEEEGDSKDSFLFGNGEFPYLKMLIHPKKVWYLSRIQWESELITLSELEEILKGEKGE